MPLDPILVPLLAAMPPLPATIDDVPAYRAQEAAGAAASVDDLMEPAPAGASRHVVQIPVDGGEVELHIFTPDTPGPHPGHLYVHGGGWIGGSIHHKDIDILCTERAVHADCVVVTVEYRKAPEHQFPIGLNDAYAALEWMDEHADELGIRRDILTIGGGSAGANIAAGAAVKARDEHGPRLVFQLLDVPALDLTMQAPSFERYATGYGITADYARTVRDMYLGPPEDARSPYASPLLADDLTGLPEAYLLPAEYDPLCDDAAAYATRLEDAGVPVTLSLQRGQWHGSSLMTKILPAGRAWRDEQLAALRAVHAAHGASSNDRQQPSDAGQQTR